MSNESDRPADLFRPVALRSGVALLCFLLTATAGVALDQWSKITAFRYLSNGVRWNSEGKVFAIPTGTNRFIPGWLHFEVMANQGAVFGVGQGRRTLFIGVSIAAIFFIFYLFAVSGRQAFTRSSWGCCLRESLGTSMTALSSATYAT